MVDFFSSGIIFYESIPNVKSRDPFNNYRKRNEAIQKLLLDYFSTADLTTLICAFQTGNHHIGDKRRLFLHLPRALDQKQLSDMQTSIKDHYSKWWDQVKKYQQCRLFFVPSTFFDQQRVIHLERYHKTAHYDVQYKQEFWAHLSHEWNVHEARLKSGISDYDRNCGIEYPMLATYGPDGARLLNVLRHAHVYVEFCQDQNVLAKCEFENSSPLKFVSASGSTSELTRCRNALDYYLNRGLCKVVKCENGRSLGTVY